MNTQSLLIMKDYILEVAKTRNSAKLTFIVENGYLTNNLVNTVEKCRQYRKLEYENIIRIFERAHCCYYTIIFEKLINSKLDDTSIICILNNMLNSSVVEELWVREFINKIDTLERQTFDLIAKLRGVIKQHPLLTLGVMFIGLGIFKAVTNT